ncbi:unnamed protein product [Rotaria socialis]|uniref:Uncharacterized protein n=1 Tax=Rotaria socialis TaxID=392032 RepID=A0A820X5B2_9BILA|nr:unnamed protein product [Rotaria socialis]CAF4856517.1 unnamed protein product [Rotaria socialis]
MLSLDSQYDSNIEEDVHLNEYDEEPTEIIACFSTLPNDILNDDENNKQLYQIELSAFHELGNNQERDDVMHDNINLLHIRGKNISDYAGQALRCLFARE